MSFDWVTFGFQLVNVLVLLAILNHFLFRPVAAIIAKRQAETAAALTRAEAARGEAEAAEKAAEEAKAATEAARHDVLAKAKEEAEAQRRVLVDAARAEAAKLAEEAKGQAQSVVSAAQAQTLMRARDLGETIARRALAELPDPPDAAGYAVRLKQAIAAMAEDQRQALLSGAGLRLIAPKPLADTEREAVFSTLSLPETAIELDPTLIAGLEMRSDTGLVHNSLAHDLDRIAQALKTEAGA